MHEKNYNRLKWHYQVDITQLQINVCSLNISEAYNIKEIVCCKVTSAADIFSSSFIFMNKFWCKSFLPLIFTVSRRCVWFKQCCLKVPCLITCYCSCKELCRDWKNILDLSEVQVFHEIVCISSSLFLCRSTLYQRIVFY